MPLAPSAVVRGAPAAVQPYYYTSALFVTRLESDISQLLTRFSTAASAGSDKSPFSIFKECWKEEGWVYVHLHCVESRARETFLLTVQRLLLSRTSLSEEPLVRVGAIFALYCFQLTQPAPLYKVDYIPIPTDTFDTLVGVDNRLTAACSATVSYILSCLQPAFRLSPSSSTLLPLPTSTLQRKPDAPTKKVGRPTQPTMRQNHALGVQALQRSVIDLNRAGPPVVPPAADYLASKDVLQGALDAEQGQMVAESVLETEDRMKAVESWARTSGLKIESFDWNGGKQIGLDLIDKDTA